MTKLYKCLFFSFFGLFAIFSASLAQVDLPYWKRADSVFRHIDTTYLHTGVLYDRVFLWSSITTLEPANDSLNFAYIMQVWEELYLATYQRSGIKDAANARRQARSHKHIAKLVEEFIGLDAKELDFVRIEGSYFTSA